MPRKEKKPKEKKAKVKKAKKLYLHTTQSVSPILDIKDGVIVSKDGSYYKLLEVEPVNFDLRSPDEKTALISQFSAAIKNWPDQIHVKVVTVRSDSTPYIERLNRSRAIEVAEGNTGCVELIDDQIQFINSVSTTQGVSRRFFITFGYVTDTGLRKRPQWSEIVTILNKEARTIASTLENCGITVISTDDREYLQEAIYIMMCKVQANYPVPYADRKAAITYRYAEKLGTADFDPSVIPVNDFIMPDSIDASLSPDYLRIDGEYVTYAYLPSDSYPYQAYGGWLQLLISYMDCVDVDFWWVKQDSSKISSKLSYMLKTSKVREYEKSDIERDYEALLESVQSGYYIKQSLASGDYLYYMATMLAIHGSTPDELETRYKEMDDFCIRNDMVLKKCTFQQEEAYISSFPLSEYNDGIFKKSRRNIMGAMLGSAFPFAANELKDPNGVLMGVDSKWLSPAYVDIWDRTRIPSGNMLIIGPTGSGKTYAMSTLALREREHQIQTVIISPTKSFELTRACSAIGGEFVKISPGSAQNINLMEIRKAASGSSSVVNGPYDTGSILVNKIQQIIDFFALILPYRDEIETKTLDDALKETYARFGITEDNNSLTDPATGQFKTMPTFRDLYEVLGTMGDKAARLHSVLSRFVIGSAKSFSEPTNVKLDNKYIVIDVGDLTDEMLPIGMFICLDFVFDMFKADRTKRKLLCCEESWKLMLNPHSAQFLLRCFREIRGYAGAIWAATQTASEFLLDSTGTGGAIWDNAPLKILMPMERKEVEALTQVMDLTSEEVKQLKRTNLSAKNGGKRSALLITNNNHIFVNVEASPMEHDLITTNADDLIRIAQQSSQEEEEYAV